MRNYLRHAFLKELFKLLLVWIIKLKRSNFWIKPIKKIFEKPVSLPSYGHRNDEIISPIPMAALTR